MSMKKGKVVRGLPFYLIVAVLIAVYLYFSTENSTPPATGTVEFHFIDVGQGDSSLIVSEDGAVLIDTGVYDYSDSLIAYIKQHTTEIDYFILTHPDSDHIGSAATVLRSLKVDNVIMTDCPANNSAYKALLSELEKNESINVLQAVAGDKYTVGDLTLSILAPLVEYNSDISANNHSIVARITHGKVSVLYTGDAEKSTENAILDKYDTKALDSDILKVGHHGSKTSSGAKFIKAVSPSLAVISCGADNDYGHPHSATLKTLSNSGITVLRTDQKGSIVIVSDGNEYTVK